jgi:hypothetical protein
MSLPGSAELKQAVGLSRTTRYAGNKYASVEKSDRQAQELITRQISEENVGQNQLTGVTRHPSRRITKRRTAGKSEL